MDFWHLVEKLAAAAPLLQGNAERRLAGWRMRLLNEEHAARAILNELKASGREERRIGDTRPVHEAITYLESHHTHMNYAKVRGAGLPIGSGNTEANCKTLVQVRMKRAGSRWNTTTGRHVIQLRALATSDRWDHAMNLTLQPLRNLRPGGRVISVISMRSTAGRTHGLQAVVASVRWTITHFDSRSKS